MQQYYPGFFLVFIFQQEDSVLTTILLWVVFDAVLLIVQRDWHGQLLGLPYRIKFTSWLARLY